MSNDYVLMSDFCEAKSNSVEMKFAMFGLYKTLKDESMSLEERMETLELLRHLHSRISH